MGYLACIALPLQGKLGIEKLCCSVQEHPETEWFMWIDSDTMIINPTFELPFSKFKGKDLIIWGNETALLAGDGLKGGDRSRCLCLCSEVYTKRPYATYGGAHLCCLHSSEGNMPDMCWHMQA